MRCCRCDRAEAAIFFKQIIHNRVTEIGLCLSCAEQADPAITGPSTLLDFVTILGAGQGHPVEAKSPQCPSCGLKFHEFRECGRLGCPDCYNSFASRLEDILERFHGARSHKGKRPPDTGNDIPELEKSLGEAIRDERFEEAAALRDRIQKAEKRPSN